MMRIPIGPRNSLTAAIFFTLTSYASAKRVTIEAQHFKVRRAECFVVGTEANRLVPTLPAPDPFSRELWSKISENVDSVRVPGTSLSVPVLTLLGIDNGFDVLGGGRAPGGSGWLPQFRDSTDVPGSLPANQRHHYAFYFFSAASDAGGDFLLSLFGTAINDLKDLVTGNDGDLALADQSTRQGALARAAASSSVVPLRIEGDLCIP